MHVHRLPDWQHTHSFGQQARRPGESRTLVVIVLNLLTMVGEIVAGLAFGSMALLADGLHMGSHTAALSLSFAAYVFARRYAGHPRFSFGTGKLNALAGFVGALLLGLFALAMFGGSLERMLDPVPIDFDAALLVAVIGLAVNAASTFVLGGGFSGAHVDHHHGHAHAEHDAEPHHHHEHDPLHAHSEDHALRSAYLHVLADALTSVFAIAALIAGKYLEWAWMDPVCGIVGALVILRWSWGLVKATAAVLLDVTPDAGLAATIRQRIELDGDELCDLHLWRVGPGHVAAILSITSDAPREPGDYKTRLADLAALAHVTVEVHRRR